MEGDEIEMSEEELQEWIKEEVRKCKLVSPDVLEKCKVLQSYLERREKRAAHLLKLCESVSACEAIVQKQYSLLGWDYTDTHSEDDDKIPNCGPSPQSACGSVQADTQDKRSSANKLQHNEHLNSNYEKICSLVLKRKPVVVLTRLPRFQISAVQPPTPKKQCSQDQLSSSSLDSEEVWKPDEDSSYSDHSIPSSETDSNNKRNLHDEKNKTSEGGATPKAIFNTETKIDATKARTSQDNSTSDANDSTNASPPTAKTDSNVNNGSKTLTRGLKINVNATPTNSSGEDNSSDPDYSISRVRSVSKNKRKFGDGNNKTSKSGATPKANSNAETKSNAAKTRTSQDNSTSDPKDGTSPPTAKTNSNIDNNGSKTSTHGAKTSDNATSKTTNAACAVRTTTPRLAGGTATKPPPSTPQTEIVVDMFVVARRREMTWQKGQIKEIQIKEDGRVKYKVFFENKGKSLVSGHHIALDCLPKVDNLVVGARVVIERPDDQECCPGILAEVPSRKNRMRCVCSWFLLMIRSHSMSAYVHYTWCTNHCQTLWMIL
ncbi:histone-lysine N-methyltransferase SETDB1-A isoform X2 [Betta splendens]|uniref:Histone-lysine N-methyltransferase SETDB1-A isoform X2 n=1 Tax=Betta splendens TaxID=158456 RepID=A0A8M1HJP8_BETSP|nr:histone-lysine N-methyltransferase SETDB1-A isoform X2 [Betta splendens]